MAATKAPPVVVIKPSTSRGGKGNAFTQWMNAHPTMKKYASAIAKWAPKYGLDPLYFAALLFHESGGNPGARHTNRNGSIDRGIAQINSTAHPNISDQQADNPGFAIHWAAQFFGAKVSAAGGDYNKAYSGKGGYNEGGPNFWTGLIPKGYVAKPGGLTPREAAGYNVEKSMAKEQITHEEFLRQWDGYNNISQAYIGRNATRAEANYLYRNGISGFTWARNLAKQPAFSKSPMWKKSAGEYIGIAKDMGMPAPKNLVAEAIVNSWSANVWQEKLRAMPQYLNSNEFKTTTAGLTNIYRSLYGNPTPEWQNHIKEAALGRWTEPQWQSYLRAHPDYRNSTEYQSNIYDLQAMFGVLPHQTPEPQIAGKAPLGPPTSSRLAPPPGPAAAAAPAHSGLAKPHPLPK